MVGGENIDESKNDPDAIIKAGDPLTSFLIMVIIASIDDAYFTGPMSRERSIQLQPYLKQVRMLSRQQFMAKALATKIMASQKSLTCSTRTCHRQCMVPIPVGKVISLSGEKVISIKNKKSFVIQVANEYANTSCRDDSSKTFGQSNALALIIRAKRNSTLLRSPTRIPPRRLMTLK